MKKIFFAFAILILLFGCVGENNNSIEPSREDSIPANAVKMTPATDVYPPILNSSEWSEPLPFGVPVNSAGAEDSPFITPDGKTFYFFFTPDPNIPAEKQLFDNVTGIWISSKLANGSWSEPERVILQEKGKLSLDGCEFVSNDLMWFCSAREGYTGVNFFTAKRVNGKWQDIQYVENKLMKDYELGEMHISANGSELFFHSQRAGGKGGLDIWVSEKKDGEWQAPENIVAVNTADNEGWPYLSSNGKELWFTRYYLGSPAIFRSIRINGTFSEPELIVSQFAGEPTLDDVGNLYFTHHFYNNSKMIEADIYIAYKK